MGRADDVGKDDALPVTDSGSGETDLVIDDEPSIRMLMVEILEEAGYLVIEAADGPLKFYSRMSTSTF